MAENPHHDEIVQLAIETLEQLNQDRPWMTAESMAKRFEVEFHQAYSAQDIQNALERHSGDADRKIRYSIYPSKKSLNVLWGHIDIVGERIDQPSLRLDAGEIDEMADQEPEIDDHSHLFLSHNSRDAAKIFAIDQCLRAIGVRCWYFEQNIMPGDEIAGAVRDAIAKTPYFAVYISGFSLGSLWVAKEYMNALSANRAFVLYDGQDEELLKILDNGIAYGTDNRSALENYVTKHADRLGLKQGALDRWKSRSEDFLRQLNEYFYREKVIYAFPDEVSEQKENLSNLEVHTFCNFKKDIKKLLSTGGEW